MISILITTSHYIVYYDFRLIIYYTKIQFVTAKVCVYLTNKSSLHTKFLVRRLYIYILYLCFIVVFQFRFRVRHRARIII